MLVLKRKAEEEVRIGPDVTVKVLAVRWGTVRLGITAPSATQIVRPEAKVQEPRLRDEPCRR